MVTCKWVLIYNTLSPSITPLKYFSLISKNNEGVLKLKIYNSSIELDWGEFSMFILHITLDLSEQEFFQ